MTMSLFLFREDFIFELSGGYYLLLIEVLLQPVHACSAVDAFHLLDLTAQVCHGLDVTDEHVKVTAEHTLI